MLIIDVIRHAHTQHAVCFLLAAYIETLQFSRVLPEGVTNLPLGRKPIQKRLRRIIAQLVDAPKRLDARGCLVAKEASQVFGTALNRLRQLAKKTSPRQRGNAGAKHLKYQGGNLEG